jgi:hypothetical protein
MWSLKDKPKTVRVTKALAREFADMEAAPRDRPLSERRLHVYQRLFAQGSFRPCTWVRADCVETGATYRVNGKHTSTLLSGLEPLPEYYVTLESYNCETLEDVAKLYATFDSKLQSRTASDINLSFAGTVPELAGLSRKAINLTVSGVNYHLDGAGTAPSTKQMAERAEVLFDHADFAVWMQGLFAGSERGERHNSRHLQRASVVAAMFGTWFKAKGPATEFWAAVRDETGESPNLPDRKLARYLLTVGVNGGMGVRRVRVADGKEIYVKSLHAWNAWRRKENTDLKYYPDKKVPGIA